MKILIRKWKSVGIAGADQDVDLMQTTDKAYRIGLFWLDSGGGKTTTHNLIKVCLTGDSSMIEDNWHKYERKSNDEFYKGEGRFDLQVSFDAEIYDFILHLNFVDKSLKFEVSGGLKGHSYNYHVPLEAKPYLKKDFVDLYIFNGEFAKSLVEEDRMSKEAEKSINTICQLDHFDRLFYQSSFHQPSPRSPMLLAPAFSVHASLFGLLLPPFPRVQSARISSHRPGPHSRFYTLLLTSFGRQLLFLWQQFYSKSPHCWDGSPGA